jgi:hypothetical protein
MTMFNFIVKLGFPVMAIIIGYEAQINPLSMEHWVKYLAHTICRILDFFTIVINPL